VDAIAPHKEIGFDTSNCCTRMVSELAPYARVPLSESRKGMVYMNTVAADPIHHRTIQDAQQPASMNRDLRPPVTGSNTPGLTPDSLPMLRIERDFACGDACVFEIVQQTEFRQFAHGMGLDVDANALLVHGRRRLIYVHLIEPGVGEGKSEGHPADASPNNSDSHTNLANIELTLRPNE
jgi:hypothetical protein